MTLLLIEDYSALTLEEQETILQDAETFRRERDERDLFDLFRMTSTTEGGRNY